MKKKRKKAAKSLKSQFVFSIIQFFAQTQNERFIKILAILIRFTKQKQLVACIFDNFIVINTFKKFQVIKKYPDKHII